MTTTVTVPNAHGTTDRLTVDVDPYTGDITVTSEAPGRVTWCQHCDSTAMALGVVADEVIRLCAEHLSIPPWVER